MVNAFWGNLDLSYPSIKLESMNCHYEWIEWIPVRRLVTKLVDDL